MNARLLYHTHAVRFGIANIHRAVFVHEHTMRADHLALQWIAFGPVTLLAGAADDINDSALRIDHADRMAFRVCQVDATIRPDADAFGPGQRCLLGRPAVAGEAGLAGARDVLQRAGFHVELV